MEAAVWITGLQGDFAGESVPRSWSGLFLIPLLASIVLPLTIGHSLGVSTTTSVSPSPNPSMYGEPVTITATVEGSGVVASTGTVRFAEDDANLEHFPG